MDYMTIYTLNNITEKLKGYLAVKAYIESKRFWLGTTQYAHDTVDLDLFDSKVSITLNTANIILTLVETEIDAMMAALPAQIQAAAAELVKTDESAG